MKVEEQKVEEHSGRWSIAVSGVGSFCCAFIMSVLLLGWFPNAAWAGAPGEQFRFPAGNDPGQLGGQLRLPTGVAADPATGHIYVGDSGNSRISEFTAEGAFVRTWGWGVVASGPDDEPQNERQELSVVATAGGFALTFRNPLKDGGALVQQTGSISFNASAATVQSALESLESPMPSDFAVTGPDGGPWVIEFTGKYADTDAAQLEVTNSTLAGTATVQTLQEGGSFEVCEAAAGDICRAGSFAGVSPGEIRGQLVGIAVDSGGNVYTFEEQREGELNTRIQKFALGGDFQLMLGGGVNKTTDENVCTKSDLEGGDQCGSGVPGAGAGEFSTKAFGSNLNRLAIGPDETLYAGDNNRIEEFDPTGSFQGEIGVSGFAGDIAVDSAGNLYVAYFEQDNVYKLTPGGLPGSPPSFSVKTPQSLAVDPAGNLYAVEDDPERFGVPELDPHVVEFDPSGGKLVPTPEEELHEEFFAQRGSFNLPGLATLRCEGGDGLGALYVTDSSGHVSVYGSNPGCEIAEPKIADRYVAAASSSTAKIAARINPNSFATTFYVEYGTEPCATSSCTQQPASPGEPLGDEGSSPVLREVSLSGLSPDTTYHYRVIAIGGATTVESEEGTFTTRRLGAGGLPDGRAYEMVSPPEKNSGDVAPQGGLSNFLMQAAAGGNSLVYPSSTPFADPEAAPPSSAYRGVRGLGGDWLTQNISPLGGALEQQVKALSADLTTEAVVSPEPPLCCGAINGLKNLYLRDLATGTYTLLTDVEPRLTVSPTEYCVGLQGFTPDFARVFFKANGALTPDAPEGAGWTLYEWTAGDGIKLVSVLPGGEPAPPAGLNNFASGDSACDSASIFAGAVSADGSHAVWSSGAALYDRVDGSETVQLDKTQGGPGPAGNGVFWAASSDGTKVFFTDKNPLVAGAHAADLYRYDFEAPAGSRLTDISTSPTVAEVRGVVGTSAAGDAAYFVAQGVLAENEGAAVAGPGGAAEKAKAGANNLYLWRAGQPLRFIARLSPTENVADPTSDVANWNVSPGGRNAGVSADGTKLAFGSVEELTAYDSTSQANGKPAREIYLYDADADVLACASCNATGARPLGPSASTAWKTPFQQPRFLSGGGGRLFFESFDALVEGDTNGRRDVYEFERVGVGDCQVASPTYSPAAGGCQALISSGLAPSNSFFLDASASGDDVFFSTADQLVEIDEDEKYDAYDARVGGISPSKPSAAPVCDGAAVPCRESSPPPPVTPPATSPPLGSGNLKSCPKGKVRRHGRCVRKHRHHKHKKHRHHRGGGK